MKKYFLMIALGFISLSLSAQSSARYVSAMKAAIAEMDSSFPNVEKLTVASQRFERIGKAEKKEWLPFYYAAYIHTMSAFIAGSGDMDQKADVIEGLLKTADSLNPKNSEVSVLKAYVATLRLVVNPMERYMKYGMVMQQELRNAQEQDSTNPRSYGLLAQSLLNTPEEFGGGCKTALPVLKQTIEKYNAFKPSGELMPVWGRERVEALLKECN